VSTAVSYGYAALCGLVLMALRVASVPRVKVDRMAAVVSVARAGQVEAATALPIWILLIGGR